MDKVDTHAPHRIPLGLRHRASPSGLLIGSDRAPQRSRPVRGCLASHFVGKDQRSADSALILGRPRHPSRVVDSVEV